MVSSEADKYETLEKIGHGSFGIIRKVKRKSDGKIVCRKEINYLKMGQREREQLSQEFNILHSLQHENIVAYYHRDHLKDQQEVHLYMEYCGGGDLSTKIKEFNRKKQHPSEEYVWDIVGQLSSALYRCHEGELAPPVPGNILGPAPEQKGLRSKTQLCILHRDLKPENIFLGEDDSVKLGDFGLSKAIAAHDFASTYVGTPYYMSPEICAQERYGWHSDIWALGCIIYELCTGRPPFDARTHFELMKKIKDCRYDPLPKMYSPELSDLVSKCLQHDYHKRPKTSEIISLPIVRIMRKGRELVAVSKALEQQKTEASRKLTQAKAKQIELQTLLTEAEREKEALIQRTRTETLESMRSEMDATVRREWEVKAQLEISKHCQMETDRLERIFEAELEKRIAIKMDAYKKSLTNTTGLNTPPLDELSRLSFESPVVEKLPGPSQRKSARTPFARAQTQVAAVDSPMDVQMMSPSPMCASLSLSPRRVAAMAGIADPSIAPTNLFTNQAAAKERWQPQLAYQSGSEDEADDGIPELPSPTTSRNRATGDPFKSKPVARPGLKRQSTVPVNTTSTQPSIFGDKGNVKTPTSPTRKPNRFLTKAVTTAAASAGLQPAGRTLVELNQARVAHLSNIPSQPASGISSHISSMMKEDVAVWDPDVEMDMPSPFLKRRGRGISGSL